MSDLIQIKFLPRISFHSPAIFKIFIPILRHRWYSHRRNDIYYSLLCFVSLRSVRCNGFMGRFASQLRVLATLPNCGVRILPLRILFNALLKCWKQHFLCVFGVREITHFSLNFWSIAVQECIFPINSGKKYIFLHPNLSRKIFSPLIVSGSYV